MKASVLFLATDLTPAASSSQRRRVVGKDTSGFEVDSHAEATSVGSLQAFFPRRLPVFTLAKKYLLRYYVLRVRSSVRAPQGGRCPRIPMFTCYGATPSFLEGGACVIRAANCKEICKGRCDGSKDRSGRRHSASRGTAGSAVPKSTNLAPRSDPVLIQNFLLRSTEMDLERQTCSRL